MVSSSLIHSIAISKNLKKLARREYEKRKKGASKRIHRKKLKLDQVSSPHPPVAPLQIVSQPLHPSLSLPMESQGLKPIQGYYDTKEETSQISLTQGMNVENPITKEDEPDTGLMNLMRPSNKQPIHLQPATVKAQKNTTVEIYRDVQDVKEIIEVGTMIDSERIVSARPSKIVKLEDGSMGVMKILCPFSAQRMSVAKAVQEKKIKFLEPARKDEKTTYQMPSSSNGGQLKSYQLKRKSKEYDQAQLMIYAGKHEDYSEDEEENYITESDCNKISFCDFVFYLSGSQQLFIERIFLSSGWCKRVIPKVKNFCEIYNQLLKPEDDDSE